ncbi:hypothetical protein IV38_GL000714 [Lactobacillus selangorensis]|uniref:S-layer protein C-terminal domain-containing protein n=2 Tax=Lactobacillus selangorensis TaxID=81857 RepID=A0A0R2FHK6_9LACO|nr:hypothetical protein IV38_GL000714 [Lactobacillus selangorensis]KRN29856.1 hypothetical protein IV40_GL000564 [Lactobacillus selangorensis]
MYFGVSAAALLAIAPVATAATSVNAATVNPSVTSATYDQTVQAALDASFNSSKANNSGYSLTDAQAAQLNGQQLSASDVESNPVLKDALKDSGLDSALASGYDFSASISGDTTTDEVKDTTAAEGSFKVTLSAYKDGNYNAVASKTITYTNATGSSTSTENAGAPVTGITIGTIGTTSSNPIVIANTGVAGDVVSVIKSQLKDGSALPVVFQNSTAMKEAIAKYGTPTSSNLQTWLSETAAYRVPSSKITYDLSSLNMTTSGEYAVSATATNNDGVSSTFTFYIQVVNTKISISNPDSATNATVTVADGAQVYSNDTTTTLNGQDPLAKGSVWKVQRVATLNGKIIAYDLGANQWVKASDVTTSAATTNNGYTTTDVSGVATITSGVPTKVWAEPNWTNATGKLLQNGTSWKVFKKAVYSNGDTWYNLGGNQWVNAMYVSFN